MMVPVDHSAATGMSQELIAELMAACLGTGQTGCIRDGALLELESDRIVLANDAFAVDPLFFGNGDIGKLAVCATVNSLAVSGAVPRCLALSLMLEQDLPATALERILDSVRATALEAGVVVAAADARILARGAVDKLLLATAGIGELQPEPALAVDRVRPGDAVIVTGWLGDHGVHVLSLRGALGFERRVLSDCAPLDGLVWNVLQEYARQVHCMRELTRGGLGAALHGLTARIDVAIELQEHRLPIRSETRTAAAALGVDPLHLPSVGSVCMFVDGAAAGEILELIRWHPQGQAAQIVGIVREHADHAVTVVTPDGTETALQAPPETSSSRLC